MFSVSALSAQTPKTDFIFTEASDLNLIGKILDDTPNPYHRVDTVRYKGFTDEENILVRCPAGLAVLFKTDSPTISVKTDYGWLCNVVNTMPIAHRGYDLYIKDGSRIEPLESPFRHRIGIFGSSFTHGISTTRAGMSYPMQLMRWTGLQFLSLACRGNCKLQPHFADVLCDADVDALVFDTFSNPDAEMIEERLFPFIEQIQKSHPDIPLIFQQTIYRERRNFDEETDKYELKKQRTAERLMKEACRKYDNVYFIQPDATDSMHETSADGTHPSDHGYTLWAQSIRKPMLKILKKYGIR